MLELESKKTRRSRRKFLSLYIGEIRRCIDRLENNFSDQIDRLVEILLEARENRWTIFVMGNGGSGSTASHFACDLAKNTIAHDNLRFKVIALTDNVPQILAWANDTEYENIFVEQLKNLLEEDDIVIGISGSGRSKNVIKALEYANENGAFTIGLTGFDGGEIKRIAKENIIVPSNSMPCCEDVHLMLEHLITSMIREELNNK